MQEQPAMNLFEFVCNLLEFIVCNFSRLLVLYRARFDHLGEVEVAIPAIQRLYCIAKEIVAIFESPESNGVVGR